MADDEALKKKWAELAAKVAAAYDELGGEKQFRKEMDAVAETIAWVQSVLDKGGKPVEGLDPVSLGQKLSPLEGSLQYLRELLERSGVMAVLDERFPELVSLLKSGALSVEEAQALQAPGLDVSAAETRENESLVRRAADQRSLVRRVANQGTPPVRRDASEILALYKELYNTGEYPWMAGVGGVVVVPLAWEIPPSKVLGQTAGMFRPNPPSLKKLLWLGEAVAPWEPKPWTVLISIGRGAEQILGAAADTALAHAHHSELVIVTPLIIGLARLITDLERLLRQE
ncbi:hypothetical protein ACX801_07080 [Arthrobacter bambusae]